MTNSTIRKFLTGLSIASLITLGVSNAAHSVSIQTKGEQSQSEKQAPPSTQSVSGKVASIGNGGTSFTLQVNGGDSDVQEINAEAGLWKVVQFTYRDEPPILSSQLAKSLILA